LPGEWVVTQIRTVAKSRPVTIAGYIRSAPREAQKHLREIYALLKEAAPGAREAVKWSSPVFEEHRILFAFKAFRSHLGFMPTPSAMTPFRKELEKYKTGKGSIQFPYDQPLPRALIRKIAAQRVKELREKDVRWM
jgi:uncharacterized protein YdhG (YjbR/CyaY superfamily)